MADIKILIKSSSEGFSTLLINLIPAYSYDVKVDDVS